VRPFFKNDDFNFLTEIALGSVYWQAADVGEVLTTVDRIHDDWTLRISPATRSLLALRMRPYGVSAPYDFFSVARDYALSIQPSP
jgi:hypothetical protein